MNAPRTNPVGEVKDALGFGKLKEEQLPAIVKMVKERKLLREPAPDCSGTGCIIAGGGKYIHWSWCSAKRLREQGWLHPIQVWHLGKDEMPDSAKPAFRELDVQTVDAHEMRNKYPMRRLAGWELKVFAVMRCPYQHVLFLDADCFVRGDVSDLFCDPIYQKTGALFFRDIAPCRKNGWAYSHCAILPPENMDPPSFEWEAGQFLVDKLRRWEPLQMVNWMNEHSEIWYRMVHGDKGTLELGFRTLDAPYYLTDKCEWSGWGISHYWRNRVRFCHYMGAKRGEHPMPEDVQELLDKAAWRI